MNKSSILVVALSALILGFGLSWYLARNQNIELESGLWFGEQARALPQFELLDHNGRELTRSDFENQWSLVFFGYTHCPDVCPASLQTLGDMVRAIDDPEVASAVNVYFVSVDPERDTPELLSAYVTYFDPGFIGVTGAADNLRSLTGALGIAHQFRNRAADSSNYDVDHSSAIVLLNPRAEFAGLFSAPHDALAMARDMARIVEYN